MPDRPDTRTADDAVLGIASEYDAFISYKHGPVDSAAAKALQRNLEHFHAPIIAGKTKGDGKRRRIRRVFLDEGELSATAAFASRIRQALKNSRWLIIICSPQTKSSPWVDLEIRTFLEFHDRDHILAVMTSGEPADIFPEAFAGSGTLPDEMLAADARGATVYEVVRKLRGDTLLRIAAPILGMTYDDLKQRHRVYQLQRFLAAASVFIVAITGFLVYASLQNRKLSQFNRDLRLRQAELVTSEASAQLEAGNNLEAVRGLLHVVTDLSGDGSSPGAAFGSDSSSEDILPSSQFELTKALNLYVPSFFPNFEDQHLAPCAVLQNREPLMSDLLSDSDGTHLLATGGRRVYVWDTAADRLVYEFAFDDFIRNWSDEAILEGDRIILCGEHNVVCYNYLTGKMIWKATVLNTVRSVSRSGSPAVSESGAGGSTDAGTDSSRPDNLYLVSDTGLTVLDADSGALLSEYAFLTGRDESLITSYSFNSGGGAGDDDSNNESAPFGRIRDSSVSESGRYLMFTADEGTEQTSLYAHDLETGKTVKIDTVPYDDECFHAASYCSQDAPDNEHVLYSKLKKSDEGCAVILTSVLMEYEDSSLTFRKEWENEISLAQQTRNARATGTQVYGSNLKICLLPDFSREGQKPSVLFICDEDLLLLSPEDGQTLGELPLTGKIMKLRYDTDHCFLYLKTGQIYDFTGEKLQLYTGIFQNNCDDIEKMAGQASFYCLRNDNTIAHYAPDQPDLNYVNLASHGNYLPSRVLYQDEDLTVLGSLTELFRISEKDDSMQVDTYTEFFKGTSNNEDAAGDNTTDSDKVLYDSDVKVLGAEDGVLHLLRNLSDGSSNFTVAHYQMRMEDGAITSENLFSTNAFINMEDDVLYDPDRHMLYIMDSRNDASVIWTYNFDTLKAVRHTLPLGLRCKFYRMSPEGDKILLLSDMDLLVLNVGTWQTEYTISLTSYSKSAINKLDSLSDKTRICWDGETLVVPDKLKLHVYDGTGRETHTIDCEYGTDSGISEGIPCAALSPSGSCLYFAYDSTLVQYSLTDDIVLNTITLPTYDSFGYASSDPWICYFEQYRDNSLSRFRIALPDLFSENSSREPKTMRIIYNNNFYCIRCDSNAFGVMTWVKGAAAYNPASGKIYLSNFNVSTRKYDYAYYREYSISDIIDIARERYGIDL